MSNKEIYMYFNIHMLLILFDRIITWIKSFLYYALSSFNDFCSCTHFQMSNSSMAMLFHIFSMVKMQRLNHNISFANFCLYDFFLSRKNFLFVCLFFVLKRYNIKKLIQILFSRFLYIATSLQDTICYTASYHILTLLPFLVLLLLLLLL